MTNKSHVKGEIYLALSLSTSDNEVTINDLTSDKDIMVRWADEGIANKNKITITNNSKSKCTDYYWAWCN